jgi:Tfp pilus assembly protein PilF
MTRSNQRRIIIYPVALVVMAALISLMIYARARDEKAFIGTLQNGGELLAKIGAHDEAEKNARKILQIDPDNLYAHLLLALTYQRTSRHEQSVREYEISLELADTPEQRQYIELVIADETRLAKDYEGARKLLDAYVQTYGDQPDAFLVRGHLHANLGQNAVAATCYQKAADGTPPARGARIALANTYVQLGKKAKALEALEKVVREGTKMRGLWYWVAELRRDLGDRDGAREALRSALEFEPGTTRKRLKKDADDWGELRPDLDAERAAIEG